MKEKTEQKIQILIRRFVGEVREQYPYLSTILSFLQWEETAAETNLSTDGARIFFHPRVMAEHYRRDRYKTLKHQLLHIICHGLLGHLGREEQYGDKVVAWAVLDLQAASIEGNLNGERELLKRSAGEIYYRAKTDEVFRKKLLKTWYQHYLTDDHGYWHSACGRNEDDACGGEPDEEIRQMWALCREQVLLSECAGTCEAKRLQDALRSMQKSGRGLQGEAAFFEVEEPGPGTDFRALLRKLCRPRECVRVLAGTFDTAFYLYGMELYGDVPLMEPMESGETESVESLVIAIDTSGSCVDSGGAFLAETGRIFCELGSMGGFQRIHVLTCDTDVRQEFCFEALGEFENFAGRHRLKGGGGTSFVPVFRRTEELQKEGERISALLYFSDAAGEFPETAPNFSTYFIMCGKSDEVKIPEWVNVVITQCAGQKKEGVK